jgi:excisionase family DNA binding protein
MANASSAPEIMTPDQAADYLQVDRETVYRYIRSGKLDASRLGRSYRIPRRNIELLLLATRTICSSSFIVSECWGGWKGDRSGR